LFHISPIFSKGLEHLTKPFVISLLTKATGRSAIYPTRVSHDQTKNLNPNRRPVPAYQFGNTVIVEGEDGEVIKTVIVEDEDGEVVETYDLPSSASTPRKSNHTRKGPRKDDGEQNYQAGDEDRRIRFTIGGSSRRLTKEDFLREIQLLDPTARAAALDPQEESSTRAEIRRRGQKDSSEPQPKDNLPVSSIDYPETAVERRRRLAALGGSGYLDTSEDNDSEISDNSGPWASGGLMTEAETQCEVTRRNSDHDGNLQTIAGSSNSEKIKVSTDLRTRNSKSSFERSIPQIIVTPSEEDQVRSTGSTDFQEGESESETREMGIEKVEKENTVRSLS